MSVLLRCLKDQRRFINKKISCHQISQLSLKPSSPENFNVNSVTSAEDGSYLATQAGEEEIDSDSFICLDFPKLTFSDESE